MQRLISLVIIIAQHFWQLLRIAVWMALALFLGSYYPQPSFLEKIQENGVLKVAMRNSPTVYYQGAEGATGYEYDLVSRFANYLGLDLEIAIPSNFSDILPAVDSNEVHMAAAGLSMTLERQQQYRFGPEIDETMAQLVYKRGTPKPRSTDDLADEELVVVAGSSHVELLQTLKDISPNFTWKEALDRDDSGLLYEVAKGDLRYTVADSNVIKVTRRYQPQLGVAFDLGGPYHIGWAFSRKHDESLTDKAFEFIEYITETGDLERLKYRYFSEPSRLAKPAGALRFSRKIETVLPKYKQWFLDAEKETAFDWRLLAAVGYQESNWNPGAVSPTGVLGIMMLTRRAAKEVQVKRRLDPEQSIRGGARYLLRMYKRIDKTIPEPDRLWMTLAAYNVGIGHLWDAKKMTRQEGADDKNWIEVKKRLARKNDKKWHSQTRHGFALGTEAVSYVENIRGYYEVLVWKTTKAAAPSADTDDQGHTVPEIDQPADLPESNMWHQAPAAL